MCQETFSQPEFVIELNWPLYAVTLTARYLLDKHTALPPERSHHLIFKTTISYDGTRPKLCRSQSELPKDQDVSQYRLEAGARPGFTLGHLGHLAQGPQLFDL
jgi:hypothetical protein